MTEVLDTEQTDQTETSTTVLEAWESILGNVAAVRDERPSLKHVVTVMRRHEYLSPINDHFSGYTQKFYDVLEDALDLLQFEAESFPKAKKAGEDDMEVNRVLYMNIYIGWMRLIQQEEIDWDLGSEDSLGHMAALTDVAAFLLGDQGLITYLDAAGFEPTDEDKELLNAVFTDEVDGE